jgi:hypothetical protein
MTQEFSETPAWIKRHQDQKAAEKKQAQDDQQRQLKRSTLIRDKGLGFWQELVEQIAINVGALKELEGEELVGTITLQDQGTERNCRFQVNRQSVRFGPALSHMSFWYIPGSGRIRRWYNDKDAGGVELVAYGDEVRASTRNGPVSACELADRTVEGMAEQVKVKHPSPSYV